MSSCGDDDLYRNTMLKDWHIDRPSVWAYFEINRSDGIRSEGKNRSGVSKGAAREWPSAVFDTQAEAIERAQELAGNGTIHIQGRHGKFRKLTVFEED